MFGRRLLLLVSLFAVSTSLIAEPKLPQYDNQKHLGVATCSSSVCHGSVEEIRRSHVLRNEYYTWTNFDRHSKSYATLLTPESKKIAQNMGLKNAHEAKVCLDCHADNVPRNMRGEKFLLTDGIGCEGCHGGAENWITSHTNEDVTHQDNLNRGLYPTDLPVERARLCLSCHYGTENKFATHLIMGAGHPRVAFELDTFTVLQPAHYVVDEDYLDRKYKEESMNVWATGILVSARTMMDILQGPVFLESGLVPELGLFDCHSCHHSMKDPNDKWRPRISTKPLKPGDLRLNDCNLVIARAIAKQLNGQWSDRLLQLTQDLHLASQKTRQQVINVSVNLDKVLARIEAEIIKQSFSTRDKLEILKNLIQLGLDGEYIDYVSAEQAVMAMDLVSASLNRRKFLKRDLDRLYEIVSNDDKYPAEQFRATLRRINNTVNAF